MIDIRSVSDIELLRESVDLECKLAAGRDGHGAVPDDVWPTYGAFANTNGGTVILGLRERSGRFEVVGLPNPRTRTQGTVRHAQQSKQGQHQPRRRCARA